jgi:hypothetical protein
MANTVLSRVDQPKVPAVCGIGTFVAVFFLAWLALIFVLGSRGVFVAPRGAPPLALLIGLLAPLSLFLLGYRTIRPLRGFVLSADLRLIVGMQAWRWAGFGFLTLYTYGVLPGISKHRMLCASTWASITCELVTPPRRISGDRECAWLSVAESENRHATLRELQT